MEKQQNEGRQDCLPSALLPAEEQNETAPAEPPIPRWRPAAEPTCCGSGCDDCPF
jgi:hypothetical protein